MSTLSELGLIGFISGLILWFGWKQRFFRWIPETSWNAGIQLYQVAAGFALYFIISFIAPVLYTQFFHPSFTTQVSFIGYATWLNFFLSTSIALALLIFWRSMPKAIRTNLWRSHSAKQSYVQDLEMSFYGWCLSFPLVLFINLLLENFLYQVMGLDYIPDQMAVRFVKMTAEYPFYFGLAIVAIVILAPLIEEFLFRGLLQSFIRKHLGSKQAIWITSLCFSFFHFSPEQGLGNIPIIASLFPLALFLGFLYERQRSLCASIGMHSLFNLLSIINLYFFGGIPCA